MILIGGMIMLSFEERENRNKNACPLGATSNPCSSAKVFPCDCIGCVEADKYFLQVYNEEKRDNIDDISISA